MKMDLGGFDLKLHEVNFAVKFSKAKAEKNLTAKCTEYRFNQMATG